MVVAPARGLVMVVAKESLRPDAYTEELRLHWIRALTTTSGGLTVAVSSAFADRETAGVKGSRVNLKKDSRPHGTLACDST